MLQARRRSTRGSSSWTAWIAKRLARAGRYRASATPATPAICAPSGLESDRQSRCRHLLLQCRNGRDRMAAAADACCAAASGGDSNSSVLPGAGGLWGGMHPCCYVRHTGRYASGAQLGHTPITRWPLFTLSAGGHTGRGRLLTPHPLPPEARACQALALEQRLNTSSWDGSEESVGLLRWRAHTRSSQRRYCILYALPSLLSCCAGAQHCWMSHVSPGHDSC